MDASVHRGLGFFFFLARFEKDLAVRGAGLLSMVAVAEPILCRLTRALTSTGPVTLGMRLFWNESVIKYIKHVR